jgi:hypothetical protein
MSSENEWNLDQKDLFEPSAKPASRRISFCPTCSRPFLRGNGVWQDRSVIDSRGHEQHDGNEKFEYCSEGCLPAISV